ncbi:MAG: YlmH/Sll1252 family protein [Lactobacillus sp.]|nr:YlmH/Sll1252 family protein [Lactobacillus sp.]
MEKIQANKYYKHFDDSERPTIEYFVGLFNQMQFKHQRILTDFLDPREFQILKTIVGNQAGLFSFGGINNAEKVRAILDPDWMPAIKSDFEISLFEIHYPSKFYQLRHSDVLGAIANLGIDLSIFGDILNFEDRWQFFVKKDFASYIQDNLPQIGRATISLEELSLEKVIIPEDNSLEQTEIVTSLRLDTLVSALTHKSRNQAQELISQGEAKLNWHSVTDFNIILNIEDLLSVRHFGRAKITQIMGTRKGKYKVVFQLWKSQKIRKN